MMNRYLSPLDFYVAATMRSSDDLRQRLRQHGVALATLDEARTAATQAGIGDPRRNTVDLIITHFGVPSEAFPDRLFYDLILWPEHRFEWKLSDWGGASFDGFCLRVGEDSLGWVPLELSAVLAHLTPHHHTSHEVIAALGDPVVDLSWGCLGEWYFGPGPTGEELCLEFDYGLLRSISTSKGVIERHQGAA